MRTRSLRRPTVRRGLLTALVGAAVALSAAGCSLTPSPGASTAASDATHAGTAAEGVTPMPGRTIAASAPDATQTLAGYRIAVVSTPDSQNTQALLEAAHSFAADSGATVSGYPAASDSSAAVAAALSEAIATSPDLVVGMGAEIVDEFSFETAQWMDQQFLVLGAQLAEPTENVTAVIWDGATSRGAAAAPDGPLSDDAVTLETARTALAAGVQSVRDEVTGVVLALP